MNKINYKSIGILLLIVLQSSLFGASVYVSPYGNDSNVGTIDKPWKTIAYAFPQLKAGDTLYMRQGTYATPTNHLDMSNSGTSTNRITVQSYPGETATIDTKNFVRTASFAAIWIRKNYVTLKNFNVTNSKTYSSPPVPAGPGATAGISMGGSHIELINLYVEKQEGPGIASNGASYCLVEHCEIVNCTTWGQDEQLSIYRSHDMTIRHNEVHHSGNITSPPHWNGIGIDIKNSCYNIELHHNHSHHNQTNGIYVDSRGESHHYNIYNNLSHDNGHNGFTVASETSTDSGRVEFFNFYNNIAYNNTNGFNLGYSSMAPNAYHDFNYVNNVSYNNSSSGFKFSTTSGASNIVVANNISRNNGANDVYDEVGGHYGLTVTTNNVSKTTGYVGSNYTTFDPQFVNISNYDFHLQPTSPVIGKGTLSYFVPTFDYDDNIRAQGSAMDLGAYKYIKLTDISNIPVDKSFIITPGELK